MLLSGKVDKDVNVKKPWIIYREFPRRSQIVCALNASDVLVIASTDNPFTKYSFPQKLFEYMAVNVPIVATSVGDVVRILKEYPNSLCRPDSLEDLKMKISVQIAKNHINYRKKAMGYTWEKLSRKLDKMIVECLARK